MNCKTEQLRVQEEGLLNLAKSTLCIHWQAEGDCTFYLSEWKNPLEEAIQLVLQLVLIATVFKPFQ